MGNSRKKVKFGWILLAGFCLSWVSSLLVVYLAIPAVHRAMSASFFAVAGSTFLLGFSVALGFVVIRPLLRNRAAPPRKIDFTDVRIFGPN